MHVLSCSVLLAKMIRCRLKEREKKKLVKRVRPKLTIDIQYCQIRLI